MVKSLMLDLFPDVGSQPLPVACAVGNVVPDLRTAYREERCFYQLYGSGKGRGVDVVSAAGIDEYAMMAKYLLWIAPLRKAEPVVCPYHKDKLTLRVGLPESFQCVDHEGWARQGHLKVAYHQPRDVLYGKTGQMQSCRVGKERVVALRFQRVEGRYQQPQFVGIAILAYPLAQLSMSKVDRVERPPVESRDDALSFCHLQGTILPSSRRYSMISKNYFVKKSLTKRRVSALASSRTSLTTI